MKAVSVYNIVESLNDHISGLFDSCKIQAYKLYGIAETVFRSNTSQPEVDEKSVGIDDTYGLIVYHKLASLTSSIDQTHGYGRSAGLIINTYGLGMIIFLDKGKNGFYPDLIAQYIQANFPDSLKLSPYTSIKTKFEGAILDSRIIFNQEYNSTDIYKLKSNQFLFRINYTIEASFDKRCFQSCLE